MKNNKNIGFVISTKENEKRRAILPSEIKKVENKQCLVFEEGYYNDFGISDDELVKLGCKVVSHEQVLEQDIICDPKIGDANYLDELKENTTIFGWIHAVQNKDITQSIVNKKITAFAWEDMYYKNRHVFWENNVIAGEAAILHAFQSYGALPYGFRCAVIGKGNIAKGAVKVLNQLGAIVDIFDRKTEQLLREELSNYDVIINAVLWDTTRKDHIISKSDLNNMKNNSLIIDISCDRNGGIETCTPTNIENPTYIINGVLHYAVDHTPALYYRSTTECLSKSISLFLDELIEDKVGPVLENACIIKEGEILDHRINEFQRIN